MKNRKPQIFWVMVDKTGYMYPHSIRHLKKDVIAYINRDSAFNWWHFQGQGRKIVKIKTQLHVPQPTESEKDET